MIDTIFIAWTGLYGNAFLLVFTWLIIYAFLTTIFDRFL